MFKVPYSAHATTTFTLVRQRSAELDRTSRDVRWMFLTSQSVYISIVDFLAHYKHACNAYCTAGIVGLSWATGGWGIRIESRPIPENCGWCLSGGKSVAGHRPQSHEHEMLKWTSAKRALFPRLFPMGCRGLWVTMALESCPFSMGHQAPWLIVIIPDGLLSFYMGNFLTRRVMILVRGISV